MNWLRFIRLHAARVRTQVTQVAEQALDKARAAGRLTARQIVGVQQAVGLHPKLMARSLESVASRDMARRADGAWRDGTCGRLTA